MRVLVVGASGFLGRHVFALARERGHEVTGTRCRTRAPGFVHYDLSTDRIWDVVPSTFLRGAGPRAAIVTTTFGRLDEVVANPAKSRAVNVDGTIRLLEDLMAQDVVTAYVSSNAVFDGQRGNYRETDARSPASEYGRQKAEVEEHLASKESKLCMVRPDKMVSDDPQEDHLFSQFYRKCLGGEPIECLAGQRFTTTSVDDVAHALLLAVSRKITGTFHVANPECFAREDLARAFLDATGFRVPVLSRTHEELGLVERRPLDWSVDSTRWRTLTGMEFTPMRRLLASFAAKLAAPDRPQVGLPAKA